MGGIAFFVTIFLLLSLLFARRNKHPADVTGFSRLLARKCPSCRSVIDHRAAYCPHCTQPTGWRPLPPEMQHENRDYCDDYHTVVHEHYFRSGDVPQRPGAYRGNRSHGRCGEHSVSRWPRSSDRDFSYEHGNNDLPRQSSPSNRDVTQRTLKHKTPLLLGKERRRS